MADTRNFPTPFPPQNATELKDDGSFLSILIIAFNFYIPCIILTLGFIGNSLTLITMTRRIRERRNVVMSYHFRALAIWDIVFCAIGETQRLILTRFPNAFDLHGDFICKEYNYLLFTSFGIAVWNVIIISIDRFVAVCFPLKASIWCTLKKARLMYAFNIGFHLLFNMVKLWKYHKPDVHIETCVNPSYFPEWFEGFILMVYYVLVNYGAPIVVLVLNTWILVRFRRRGIELVALEEKGSSMKKESQERSLTVMMLVVAFTFMILMIIYPIEDTVWDYIIPDIARSHPRIRELSFYIKYYSPTANSCINFYIYFVVSVSFRNEVIRLLNIQNVLQK
jgi:preprotein translocase subunit SecG